MSGSGTRFVWPNVFSVNPAGVPLVGAQLFFYETGTNTPQNTYSDEALTVPNTNPVISDANGYFGNVFLLPSPAYRVVLEDSTGAIVWSMDPVGPSVGGGGGGGGSSTVPAGAILPYAGSSAPNAAWLLCFGQNVSRVTYSVLFGIVGTTYGVGDGSTTFGIPDLRGRVLVGKDNMGGAAANRVTAGISGLDGVTLGAAGGDQSVQTHNHGLTDPGHTHTDSGHTHTTDARSYPTVGGPLAASGSFAFTLPLANVNSGNANIQSSTTGITIANYGSGGSQNVQPSIIVNYIIATGN